MLEKHMSRPTNPLTVRVNAIEPKWGHALRVWWAWQWRIAVFGVLIELFIQLLGYAHGILGLTLQTLTTVRIGLALVFSGLVGIYLFKLILDSDFGSFRVCIISKDFPPQ
jgi:hypothetical protein